MRNIPTHTLLWIAAVMMAACLPVASAMESASFQMSGGLGQPTQAAGSTYTLRGGIEWMREEQAWELSAARASSSAASVGASSTAKVIINNGNPQGKPASNTKAPAAGPKPPSRTGVQSTAAKPAAPAQKPAAAPAVKPAIPGLKPIAAPAVKPAAPQKTENAKTMERKVSPSKLSETQMQNNRSKRTTMRILKRRLSFLPPTVGGRLPKRVRNSPLLLGVLMLGETAGNAMTRPSTASLSASLLGSSAGGMGLGTLIGTVLGASGVAALQMRTSRRRPGNRKRRAHPLALLLCFGLIAAGAIAPTLSRQGQNASVAHAGQSVPRRFAYNGRLLQSGLPVTTPHTMRFSYWSSPNAVAGDMLGNGSINTHATSFADWQETVTVTPDGQGYFSVELGGNEALPDMAELSFGTLLSMYLQVEVKPAASPQTAFELMDTNPANDAIDRTGMLSVPFAMNADTVDKRDVGSGSGSIPLLGPGGILPATVLPITIPGDSFTLDNDDSAATPSLRFGTVLNQTLSFDSALSRFSFSDDVHVAGNLTLTGTVNGIDIVALAQSVASGATVVQVFQPVFPGAAYEEDGTANTGRLSVAGDDTDGRRFYLWQTTKGTLQDYDIVVRFRLPHDFKAWNPSPLKVSYKTSTGVQAQNAVQLAVLDTDGNNVTLTGGSATLASSAWEDITRRFAGTPTWSPGEEMTIRFTMKATADRSAQLGAFTLEYEKN